MKQIIIIKSFLRFLAVAIIVAFSLAASIKAQDGITWSVKLDPDNNRQVLITVKTTNLKSNYYLGKVKCKVYFYNQNNEQIGENDFAFTTTTPRFLSARKTFLKKFLFSFASAALVKGDDMFYTIFTDGGKADGGALVVKKGKIKADPK